MANFALKMKLIVWKNLIIRKRRWIFTTFEIVLPVLLYLSLAMLNTLIPDFQKHYVNETGYYPVEEYSSVYNVFYAPNNTQTNNIMNAVQEKHCNSESDNCKYRGFESEEKLLNYISQEEYVYDRIAVVFNNVPEDKLPNKLDYRIRERPPYFDITRLYSSAPPFQAYEFRRYTYSFIQLQASIDSAFIDLKNSQSKSPRKIDYKFTFQQLPDPPHYSNLSLNFVFSKIMPICTVFSFMLVFVGIIQRVMEEKASGIKELMKMMGLKSWMLWSGWYIHSILAIIISITVITILLKVPLSSESAALFKYSDGFLLWIFLFMYCTAGICFCFMVSTWFSKPMIGSSVGTVVWILTVVPAQILENKDNPNSLSFIRSLTLLLPNACLSYGFKTMYEYEDKEIGMQWSNLYSTPNSYSPFHSIGKILWMLVVDSLIFLILTWYIDNVNPGDYGISRSCKFPFEKSYWCPRVEPDTDSSENSTSEKAEIEPVPPNLQAGIIIKNLNKEFKKKKAVNGLNFDIYTNQLTVLLGHNGAGKTTTMNIVTGMIAPTSGSVLVDGYSVQTNLDKVRESLGLCPQHNVQFPDLTVIEHLIFFAMLKGMNASQAKKESLNYLARLCMTAKANKPASTLSGGMRRRLSLGMALVGNTKVLMLDEPTSGMDPEARREIWDLLLSMRGERTILITTHYMEEADILGDRIAIMHSGQLMCYGTSLFLKKHYGTGYTLSVLLSRELDINIIKNAILNTVPNATIKNISIGSVKFELPTNDTSALTKLFLDLEQNKDSLGIASFGVSLTTMDDVFLKVGKIADEIDGHHSNSETDSETPLLNGNTAGNGQSSWQQHGERKVTRKFQVASRKIEHVLFVCKFCGAILVALSCAIKLAARIASSKTGGKDIFNTFFIENHNVGFNLVIQQFWALILKRIFYTRHKIFIFIVALLIPIAFLILTIFSSDNGTSLSKNVTQELHLGIYPDTITFYSHTKETEALSKYYKKVVQQQNSQAVLSQDVSDSVVAIAEEDMNKYHSKLVVAAELNYTDNIMVLNAMYGRFPIHGSPISINLLTNALLKFYMNDVSDQYSINLGNNPLPENSSFGSEDDGIIWISLFPMGLALFIGLLLGFHTTERLSGVKHLQIMSGVSRIMYWLNNYFIDMLLYLFVTIICIIIIAVMDPTLAKSVTLQAFTGLMLLFGLSVLPFTYFFHYRPTSGSVVTFTIWAKIIFGTILPLIIIVWETAPDSKKELREALTFIYMLCPHFAFSYGLNRLIIRASDIYKWENMPESKKPDQCSNFGCCDLQSEECKTFYNFYAGKNTLIPSVLFLTAEIFIYFILFLFVDYGLLSKYFDKTIDLIRGTSPESNNNLDSDVVDEQKRVASIINETQRTSTIRDNTDVLLVSNLRKWFGKFKKFHAVKGLNFGVKEHECFGLLGINGAGKTTTFKMLTGEIFVSTGMAKIHEYALLRNQGAYLKQIGYCPQFDAFNFQLSTRQMLTCFAHLRGIQQSEIEFEVDKWLTRFDIMKYQHIQCSKMSGGNKRKLSTAMALIGDPPLIMLDEPTSGVDPVARRNLWSILAALRRSGQAIVLTSHSMDECEALCDRLAIMVDGQMKCIGDIQYLKNKFGQGFTIMIKLRHITTVQDNDNVSFETELSDLKSAIESKYACTLKDEHKGMIMYHLTDNNVTLGEIFKHLEMLKQTRVIVEDFTVGNTSLEQVFLSFAKEKLAAADKQNTAPRSNIV